MGYTYKYNVYKIASWESKRTYNDQVRVYRDDGLAPTWYKKYTFYKDEGRYYMDNDSLYRTYDPNNGDAIHRLPGTGVGGVAKIHVFNGRYVTKGDIYEYSLDTLTAHPVKGPLLRTTYLSSKAEEVKYGDTEYYELVDTIWNPPTPTNRAPVISGEDIDLGEKNRPFDFEYSVKDPDGDNVTIVEYLNNSVLRSITNAGDVVQTVRVTDNVFKDKVVNGRNTIKIKATDTAGNTSYRTVYFTRTNNPPTFEEPDKNLGLIKENPTFTFTPNDLDGDKVKCRIKLNQKVIKEYPELTLGEKVSFKMDFKNWMQLNHTVVHNLWIELEDSAGAIAILKYTFQRDVDRIFYENHQKIDEKPRNIVFTADVDLDIGATMKMYVTNDYSNELAWEEVENGQIHTFQNVNAGENDIGFRIEITKGKGTSVLKRLGGSYN